MKDILKYLCTWKFWKELLIMTLGMAIAAAAVYYFMMPSKLVLGSISGLSIVITNVLNMVGIRMPYKRDCGNGKKVVPLHPKIIHCKVKIKITNN